MTEKEALDQVIIGLVLVGGGEGYKGSCIEMDCIGIEGLGETARSDGSEEVV